MKTTVTVRGSDPQRKSWLRHEAQAHGVSMDALEGHCIGERREKARRHAPPAEAFKRHFGPEHGLELLVGGRYGYQRLHFEGARRG